jgi:hypothetical protein
MHSNQKPLRPEQEDDMDEIDLYVQGNVAERLCLTMTESTTKASECQALEHSSPPNFSPTSTGSSS